MMSSGLWLMMTMWGAVGSTAVGPVSGSWSSLQATPRSARTTLWTNRDKTGNDGGGEK
jgi:hypothetical protein